MMLRTKMIRRLGVVILLWIGSVSIAHTQPSGFMEKDVTVHGFNMHYIEAGSGPPLVLLHGLWGGQNEWRLNMEPLSTNFRVIALDQIGFGKSDKPHANYHNALLAQFLVGFLEAVEIP
ncbi:MAG TPA: alpha/beta fold hydrolase, partial [Candidatus Marinimicrobia bacterium]|nr:alpha/beta fold hydrolase [Candidatus Neomarinimicrobiota bacterium]